jgi:hypothetical protein
MYQHSVACQEGLPSHQKGIHPNHYLWESKSGGVRSPMHSWKRTIAASPTLRNPIGARKCGRQRANMSEAPKPRSSNRISLHLPVLVYGRSNAEVSFQEDTTTLLVNASGGLVPLASKVGLGDTVFVVNEATKQEQQCRVAYVGPEFERKLKVGVAFKDPSPNFWGNKRRELRIPKSLRVRVRGVDRNAQKFTQSALIVDVSQHGARLDGISSLTAPGETIEVRRLWRKAYFRVVWVGEIGRPQAGHVGLFCVEPNRNIWGIRRT